MPFDLNILAQREDFDWSSLLYLLIFLVFPALNSLGAWIRKKWGAEQEDQRVVDKGGAVYEVSIGKDGETILTLADKSKQKKAESQPAQRHTRPVAAAPVPPPPQARRAHPARPARPAARPHTTPVQQPAPARRAPAPASTHPAAAQPRRKARPALVGESDTHSVFEHDDAIEVVVIEETAPHTEKKSALLASESFDSDALRKAVILSEILAPPVSIRGPSSTPFARPD